MCYKTVHTIWHRIPATCPTKFSKLNSLQHVAATKLPKMFCCRTLKWSGHKRGRIAALYPGEMSLPHFRVCVNLMWFCPGCYIPPLHVLATCPLCVNRTTHDFVTAACPCDMSLRHDPLCAGNLKAWLPSVPDHIRNVKFVNESVYNMRCLVMFITAVCLLFLPSSKCFQHMLHLYLRVSYF